MHTELFVQALKTIDVDNNGKMSLIEYLIFKYKKTVSETNSAPQGDNAAAIKVAQQKVDAVLAQVRSESTKNKQTITQTNNVHFGNWLRSNNLCRIFFRRA